MEVMGYQFAWEARYPGKDGELGAFDFRKVEPTNQMGLDLDDRNSYDDFMPLEIYLPKGRAVEMKIRARDVLHSVHLPHFRQKMDAMPGMPTRLWFTPTKTTAEMREETGNPEFNYELACTEICGRGHFSMKKTVIVVEADEFDKWYAEQESWLTNNPDLLKKIPEAQRPAAAKAAGIILPAVDTAKEPLQAQVN
jgi:cytochrome c oxidase subunit 2